MPEIHPFRGVRYSEAKIKHTESVVAPPYDEISEQEQAVLYQADPYNIVRLILGKEAPGDNGHENQYTRAVRDWNVWQKEGILRQDENPALYIYEQEFTLPSGERKARRGFMGRVRLECLDSGRIRPHENTHHAPIEDRLRLIRACRANLSPVLSIYDDPGNSVDRLLVTEKNPQIDFSDSHGIHHRLWLLEDEERIAGIRQAMQSKGVFIADGHHRYSTALKYLEEQRQNTPNLSPDAPSNFIMMMFVNLHNEALTILPIHRLVRSSIEVEEDYFFRRLKDDFFIEPFKGNSGSSKEFFHAVADRGADYHSFGLVFPGERFFTISLKGDRGNPVQRQTTEDLDITILHTRIMQDILGIPSTDPQKRHIHYTPDASAALAGVRDNHYRMAFLLNPTKVEEIKTVASAGGKMPQKSTFFYPKPLSGLVMYKFDE